MSMFMKEFELDKIKNDITHEWSMLEGNITRICLTDDNEELSRMVGFAVYRIHELEKLKREYISISKEPSGESDNG